MTKKYKNSGNIQNNSDFNSDPCDHMLCGCP